jgi:hypothetical protein
LRGLQTAQLRLGVETGVGDRRARAELLAEGLISLRRAVQRGTLA